MTKEEIIKNILSVQRTCRGKLDPELADQKNQLLLDGKLEEAKIIDNQRVPCGQDVNKIMVQSKFDGSVESVPCPKCGAKLVFRNPKEE